MVIELERLPNGFRVKPEQKTVFVLKKNALNPELNIHQKPLDAPPSIRETETKPANFPQSFTHVNIKPKPLAPQPENETQVPAKIEEPKTIEGKFKAGFSVLQPVIIPTSSIWFDYKNIHRIEKDAFYEFFSESASKSPENYKMIRNKILQLFYSNPHKYLTGIYCVERLGFDSCSILRIHSFLEHWGLINFVFDINSQNHKNIMNLRQNVETMQEGEIKRKIRFTQNLSVLPRTGKKK